VKRKLIIFVLSVVVLTGLVSAYLWQDYQKFSRQPLPLKDDAVFQLVRGTGFMELQKQLTQQGWITQPFYFKLLARHSGYGRKLKAGEYEIPAGTTPLKLLEILASGKSIQHRFTIIEGTRFKELRAQLLADQRLTHTLAEQSDAKVLEAIEAEYVHPEGLFLAETYQFQRGDTDLSILKRANKLLQSRLSEAWKSRADKVSYKQPYEALIMASIIEKETGQPKERPQIAGVFTRRLAKGMRLQTDPTVIYGMGDGYNGNITRADLRRPTEYNTYVIKGLPPTPIAMVGVEAIQAALNPADGKSLYFVAKGDGTHAFSATLNEHNRAVRKYQLQRRKNYRSSPE